MQAQNAKRLFSPAFRQSRRRLPSARAASKGNKRYFVLRTNLDDLAYLVSRLREGNGIRRYARMIRRILAMSLAYPSRMEAAVDKRSPSSSCSDAVQHGFERQLQQLEHDLPFTCSLL